MRRAIAGIVCLLAAAPAARGDEVWLGEGVVVPRLSASLRARATDTVAEVLCDVGDAVKKDQVLARLDDKAARLDLRLAQLGVRKREAELKQAKAKADAAKARLAHAKAEFDRAKQLGNAADKETLARKEADYAQAGAAVAEAEAALDLGSTELEIARTFLEAEQLKLDHLTVRAPFDGVVVARYAVAGEFVRADQALVDLIGRPYLVEAAVPERLLAYVSVGRPVEVRVGKDRAARMMAGKVIRMAVNLDPRSRMLRMEIDLPDPKATLRPGTLVEVKTDETDAEKKEREKEEGKEKEKEKDKEKEKE